jgi:PAS domain S-box-containing protein
MATPQLASVVPVPHHPKPDFLTGRGELGELMRTLDWSTTPLGPPERWPQSLRTAVDIVLSSRYAMFVWWGRELINLYNDAYRPFLGQKHPHSLGQSAREVWAEIWDTIGPRTDAVLKEAESTFDEALLLLMDRFGYPEETYFTFSYSPIRGDGGEVGGLFCAVTEETRRVIGERRMKLLREIAATASQTPTPEGVCSAAAACMSRSTRDLPFVLLYLKDGDGRSLRLAAQVGMASSSPAAARHFNLETGNSIWPFEKAALETKGWVLEDLSSHAQDWPKGAWDRPPQRAVIVPLWEHDRGVIAGFLVLGLNPYLPFEEEYQGFVGLLADQLAAGIARARAYQEERHRAEALAEIDRAKTAFFSNVSHEFRTPLTLMLGPIEEMLSDTGISTCCREQLRLAHRNALRLQKLVNSLLDFARIEAGRMQASYAPTDLAALTEDLASNFRSAMERAGLTFEVSCDALGEDWYIDREMWEKIVLNLLSNAFKFTHAGAVRVHLRRHTSHAVLTVVDTGVGIPTSELPRVFERFHRAEGTQGRTHEGSGIGLALVKELVHLHGGDIEAASELGTGTTFTVRIPAGRSHLPPESIQAERTLSSTSICAGSFVQEALRWLPDAVVAEGIDARQAEYLPGGGRYSATSGARIVLADDNADMRAYLQRLLSPYYRVEAVADGEAALAAIRHDPPALVLSDVMMPRLDGLGLLQALRRDPALRAIPIILLSARAGEDERTGGFGAGADDYLVKPFVGSEMLARVGSLLELTQLRRAQEERLRLAVEGARMATWDWNIVTDELHWSSTLFELLGYPADPRGRAPYALWAERIHPEDRERVAQAFNEARSHLTEYRCEYRILRADNGETRWVSSCARFLSEGGTATRSVGIFFDVTERHQAEDSLREADRRKNEFLAMLAHELRNPLAPIRNAVEIVERLTPGEPRAGAALAIAKRQISQLTRLVDDLLDVSRITQGRIQLHQRTIELSHVIAQAVEAVEPLFLEKQHRVSVHTASVPPLRASADPARLVQCVVNVLTNAAKYTDPGGEISVQTRARGKNAVIEISDSGVGITPALLPRIFDLFVQGNRTLDRSQGGLGVGLALVKQLMEMHGGSVKARSDGPGRGSSFELAIPLIEATPEEDGEQGRPAPRHERILIVDDNRDAAETLAVLLQLQGHEVHTANTAHEVVRRAHELRPSVILLDIGLPELNGYEIARRLRTDPALESVRLVAVTGYGQNEDRARARQAGFDAHVVKPVDLARLERAFSKVSSIDEFGRA